MEDYAAEYRRITPKSADLFARSTGLHVNGVSHNIRFFKPYPFVVRRSAGSGLVDVDGNRYTDYWMGHWSLILGHGPVRVRRSLARQVREGWMYGTVNEQTLRLSGMIAGAVGAAEKIRYTASGTEATMYATRLARSYTGRKMIAKIDGGWHGYASSLLQTVNWPFEEVESGGLVGDDQVVSLPYNDLEGSLDILSRHRGDLAGVIAEPVLGGGGGIPADADYLRGLGEFARGNGSLFMLDEIVTGFRLRFGCIYDTMGLDPDIITLGKIVGGGLAIGAVCGKDEVMRLAGPSETKSGRAYIGGGTFSANPVSMTAGYSTLSELKANGSIYSRIGNLGKRARDGISRALDGAVEVTGAGSLFMTHFVRDGVSGIASAADAARCDAGMLHRYHMKMIARDGIFFLPGKMGAVSAAHTASDIGSLVLASEGFAHELPR